MLPWWEWGKNECLSGASASIVKTRTLHSLSFCGVSFLKISSRFLSSGNTFMKGWVFFFLYISFSCFFMLIHFKLILFNRLAICHDSSSCAAGIALDFRHLLRRRPIVSESNGEAGGKCPVLFSAVNTQCLMPIKQHWAQTKSHSQPPLIPLSYVPVVKSIIVQRYLEENK